MRTTITLEDDVAAGLARLQKRRKLKLKRAVNEALRAGLRQLEAPGPRPEPFAVRAHDLGGCLIGEIVSVSEALASGEGEGHR